MISVESITKKAVEAYMSESRALKAQASTSSSNMEYVGDNTLVEDYADNTEGQSNGALDTPVIQVDKISSSSVGVPQKIDRENSGKESEVAESTGKVPEETAQLPQELMDQVRTFNTLLHDDI